jgi:hypothetical protein
VIGRILVAWTKDHDDRTSEPIGTVTCLPRRIAGCGDLDAGRDLRRDNGVSMMGIAGAEQPFQVEIVGEETGALRLASGVPIDVQRSIDDIAACDILIVPSDLLKPNGWKTGRYPRLVDWVQRCTMAARDPAPPAQASSS